MSKVCVLIGEGKSEKAFFPSLLVNKLSFQEAQDKNCIVYQSKKNPDLFWIFPVPSFGPTHQGGFRMLQEKDIYVDCKYIVKNHKHLFGDNPDIHYRIIVDTDNHSQEIVQDRIQKISDALSQADLGSATKKIYPINVEIETWFMAGIKQDFPFLHDINRVRKILALDDIEILNEPKKELDSILEKSIAGNTQRIGRDIGEYFHVEQAKLKSKSFNMLFVSLETDGLVI